jgi:hypothetical protein
MRKLLATLLAATIAIAVLGSCSDEQKRDFGGAAVMAALRKETDDVLDEKNVDVDGELDCKADIANDSKTMTGSCSGKDEAGTALTSTLNGTVDIDSVDCQSHLVVKRGDETLLDDPNFDCSEL